MPKSEVRISLACRGRESYTATQERPKILGHLIKSDGRYIGQGQRSLTRCGKLGGLSKATVFLIIALVQLLEAAAIHGGCRGWKLPVTHADLRSGQQGRGDTLTVLQKGVLVLFPLQEVSTHVEVSIHRAVGGGSPVVPHPALWHLPSLTSTHLITDSH